MPRVKKAKEPSKPNVLGVAIDWVQVASFYKKALDWELVAQALPCLRGGTVQELERLLRADQNAPCHSLERWGAALAAEAQIETASDTSSQVDPLAYLCHKCPAAELFRGGHSIDDVFTLLEREPCPDAEKCRKKAMIAEKMYLRAVQSIKAGKDSKMAQYLGGAILHQGEGGDEDFNPVEIRFTT